MNKLIWVNRRRLSWAMGLLSTTLLLAVIIASFLLFPNWLAHAIAPPPVLLLHGFTGNCSGSMGNASTYLKSKGLATINLGFYGNDSGCDSLITESYGPTSYSGVAGCPPLDTTSAQTLDKQRTVNTNYPIEKLGYHLAWYIYQNYSINGQYVDLLAHSMGGLIIRSAIAQTIGQATSGCTDQATTGAGLGPLPPKLLISRVATISSPHDGASIADADPFSLQAKEMQPDSVFLHDLAIFDLTGNAQWLTMGENCVALAHSDGVVSAATAAWPDGIGSIQRITYNGCKWVHTNIELDTSDVADQNATITLAGSVVGTGIDHTGCDRPLAMSNNWFEYAVSPECSN